MNVSRTPTADEINALPQHVRDYIHWLATDADPAGTLMRNYFLEQQNAQLRALLEQEFNVLPPNLGHFNCAGDYVLPDGTKIPERVAMRQAPVPTVVGGMRPKVLYESNPSGPSWAQQRFLDLPQEIQQTQRSHNEWPTDLVDNAALRQCMYRAEADFHKGSKSFLTKREQGHIMGLFRNVITAFVNTITQTRE